MGNHSKRTTSKAALTEADRCFASVVAAFATRDAVTRGNIMSSYALKVNKKIFAMCGRGKFVAKLPKPRADEIVRTGEGDRSPSDEGMDRYPTREGKLGRARERGV